MYPHETCYRPCAGLDRGGDPTDCFDCLFFWFWFFGGIHID